jgi:MFS family permease
MDPTTQPSSEEPVARARERASTAGRPRAVAQFSTFTSLHHRDFVFLWLSNLCNASANWFQQFTIPWLVWDISHSPLWVGIAAGMRSFPFLFIGPLAGVFADRVNRRILVLVIQTIMAVVVFAFAVAVLEGYVQEHSVILTPHREAFYNREKQFDPPIGKDSPWAVLRLSR